MWKVIKGLILLTGLAECQLQHFLRTPQDTEVTEGDTAVLLCQVGNQIGQVQWTKDGLTLGYDRLLPGFDRYSVLGNDSLGTYNLQVSNASVQDDAKYECQVGPGRGNPPIRANAYLTVNLPPTQIQIMNHLSGSRIDIKENAEVEISCKVSNAKPRAGIIWYRNNVAFNPGTGNIEESSEDGTLPDRKTTFSKIKFRPNSADNQATYACEASHPALRGTAARPANPMRSSVLLSVLYPPEKPEIQGYIEGETIRMGQAVTLVCESYGGNPLAAIVWYKNNQRIDHSYTTSGSKSKNTIMFLAQPDDNNAAYRCEAKNTMIREPLTAQIVMSVQFAPDRVEIRGPATAKVGQTLNFECATSNSNPASTLQWVIDGKAQPAIHNRTDTSAEGGWVTISNVSVMVGHLDKSKSISCYANNFALSETKVETHIVTVLYPPDELSITGYKQGDILQEGSLRRIKCTALSGNPLPELEWFAADKKVEGAKIEKAESGTFVSSEISIKVDRSDNGKSYQCKAKSEATEEPFRKSVALKVSFPPTRVKVEVEPESPIEGNPAVLKCLTDSSSPDVEILWWHNGELVAGSESQTKAGKFGGSMTSSLLQIDVTEAHINSVYKCEARHTATSKSVSNTTKIAVQYKPQFIDAPKEIDIEVNSSRIFNINAKGNPEILKYSWIKKGGTEIPSLNNSPLQRGIAASGHSLHLNKIQVEDTGTYIVRVENSIGKSRKSIKVNVEYPPRFVKITRSKLINEGESVKLLCQVDGFPLKTDTIKWERDGYDIGSRATVETTTNGSVLSIQNATIKDAGIFICLANNGVPRGRPVEIREKLFLLVNHKPIIDDSPELSKSASDKGGTGKLICQADGAPNVTFKWFREGRAINEDNAAKYSVLDKSLDPLTWQSELKVKNIALRDYGHYGCAASNIWGTSQHQVILSATSKPDPPQRLRVLSSTYNSVILTWQPGFNGGFQQYFRIRLQRVGSEGFLFVDVFPHLPAATAFEVSDLQMDTAYSFSIMAFNKLGESAYTSELVQTRTAKSPPPGARQQMINSVLEERAEIPFIIIASVSVAGIFLLILNVVLLYCFIQNRKTENIKDNLSLGGSSRGSSKSATIEMYVGSSYNETISGETLSSLSEKSDTYFTSDLENRHRQDFADEFDTGVRLPASTYLVDHNPIYSSDHYDPNLPSRPVSRSLSSVYGTMPRHTVPQHSYTYQEDLSRQRSISHLDAPEGPLTLHQFPRHQMSDHLSQARVPEQSQGYFSARNYNLSPPHHAPHLPHIYSNHPPSMFAPDLPPPPPTPQEMQDQSYSYQNIQQIGPVSQRTLHRGQRFGDV